MLNKNFVNVKDIKTGDVVFHKDWEGTTQGPVDVFELNEVIVFSDALPVVDNIDYNRPITNLYDVDLDPDGWYEVDLRFWI